MDNQNSLCVIMYLIWGTILVLFNTADSSINSIIRHSVNVWWMTDWMDWITKLAQRGWKTWPCRTPSNDQNWEWTHNYFDAPNHEISFILHHHYKKNKWGLFSSLSPMFPFFLTPFLSILQYSPKFFFTGFSYPFEPWNKTILLLSSQVILTTGGTYPSEFSFHF